MKKWDKQIPVMTSANILMKYRNKIWSEIRDNPNMSSTQLDKYTSTLKKLNERINRRTISPRELDEIAKEVKRIKNPGRVAKKIKRSRRQVNYLLTIKRKSNGKEKAARKKGTSKKKDNQG